MTCNKCNFEKLHNIIETIGLNKTLKDKKLKYKCSIKKYCSDRGTKKCFKCKYYNIITKSYFEEKMRRMDENS